MSEVLKWFENNIYYSVNSGTASFSIQNEDLWEFEELLKKQDRELQQKENIIKEVREYIMSELITEWDIKNGGHVSGSDLPVEAITPILEILDKENK